MPGRLNAVYLDHNATTPVASAVRERMDAATAELYGNPSSATHLIGLEAAQAVAHAREQVATLVNLCAASDPASRRGGEVPFDVVFTSGGTEANNLAIRGVIAHARRVGPAPATLPHIVTAATEHPAVLDTCRDLADAGAARLTVLKVDAAGHVALAELEASAREPGTALVSVMAANNEIGTLHDLAAIGACLDRVDPSRAAARHARSGGGVVVKGAAAHPPPIRFHTDAVQLAGVAPLDLARAGVDLATLTAHKLYGPKGIGALVCARWMRGAIVPLMTGGGQQDGLRPGTLPVPLIAGFGVACEIVREQIDTGTEAARLRTLRDRLWDGLDARIPDLVRNGATADAACLPQTLSVSVPYVDAEALGQRISETLAVSAGSACTSASLEPSHVLRAIGRSQALASATIRFGLGRSTTPRDVAYAVDQVVRVVDKLRDLHPGWQLRQAGVSPSAIPGT